MNLQVFATATKYGGDRWSTDTKLVIDELIADGGLTAFNSLTAAAIKHHNRRAGRRAEGKVTVNTFAIVSLTIPTQLACDLLASGDIRCSDAGDIVPGGKEFRISPRALQALRPAWTEVNAITGDKPESNVWVRLLTAEQLEMVYGCVAGTEA